MKKCDCENLDFFANELSVNRKYIEEYMEFYNNYYSIYNNDIYKSIETRITHWVNFIKRDWFSKRIYIFLEYIYNLLKENKKVLLIDVGFSVQYSRFIEDLRYNENLFSVLVDKEKSCIEFDGLLQKCYSGVENFDIITMDIENQNLINSLFDQINNYIDYFSPQHVLVVASELIEHLNDDKSFWYFINNIDLTNNIDLSLYITLPIGNIIPSHTLSFDEITSAEKYLSDYIKIIDEFILKPPHDEVMSPYLTSCYCAFGKRINRHSMDY